MDEAKDTLDETKKAQTDESGKLTKIKVGDKEYNVINSVQMIEIVVHKLDDGKEYAQVVAHEFMMTEHKPYMVKLLTDAINTVMRAEKRQNYIKLASEAMFNRLRNNLGFKRFLNNKKGGLN